MEQHPLLAFMEQGDGEAQHREHEPELEQAMLAHRMDELRWSETRRGAWAQKPDPRARPPADPDGTALKAAARQALERRPAGAGGAAALRGAQGAAQGAGAGGNAGAAGAPPVTEDWYALLRQLDPTGSGFIAPDALIPLMFWLGLTRRRGAALVTLELAFGPGDVPAESLAQLCPYIEVQVRLVEGLRKLARKETLEQLCEFMTDGDLLRLRTWFYSMRRSPAGAVDLVEVQNLFAREGVTSDRQALFRFLSHVTKSGLLPAFAGTDVDKGAKHGFGIEEFASIICRCTIAWALQRTLGLLRTGPAANASSLVSEEPQAPKAFADENDMSLRWTQLQRKIIVSLLVNHRFWGRESRNVLGALQPPGATTIQDDLTPEQWQSLFQRVRAQGMAAILPIGEEAEDPGFLRSKTMHADIPGTQPG